MFFRHWRRKRILKQHCIPLTDWQAMAVNLPLLHDLSDAESIRMRELATLFLHEKSLEAVDGLELNEAMRLDLAAQAVLPILNLGIDWYEGWTSLVLYPDEFATRHEWMDEAGVVHVRREIRSGEAWQIGPVVLSWADVAASGTGEGYNAVIHEMAHKLDMSNSLMDGCPRLHGDMRAADWRDAFKPAYENFCCRVDKGEETALDPYGSEAPEEFFAVTSEYFFEQPGLLKQEYPEVYKQLAAFYRQDPISRFLT